MIYWIALSLIDDIGPVISKKLIEIFGEPEKIFNASRDDLLSIEGIGIKRVESIKSFSKWKIAEDIIRETESLGIRIITLNDPQYPEHLKTIPDPPPVIYIKGEPVSNDRYALGIVGTRRPTNYGRYVAERLAEEISLLGITVVSGLARGIDTVSHLSSLKAGSRSIGVFASGLDIIYPPDNKRLVEKIIDNGYVLSEFPPGTPPEKENFPRRNRLISGLSLGVVVIEAPLESGALITAHYAVEQGREVFAVPGNINSRNSEGTNNLLKQGAKVVTSVDDIINELSSHLRGFIRKDKQSSLEINDIEKDIINVLSYEPAHVDDIARSSKKSVSETLSILLQLELKGIVKQMEGKRFYITREVK